MARLLAIGYSQTLAAERYALDLKRVQRWCARADYQELINAYHEAAWKRIEPGIMANVALAIDVQRQMLIGEVPASDRRYREAKELISRILDRLLYVEPRESEDEPPALGQTVNILLPQNGNGSHS